MKLRSNRHDFEAEFGHLFVTFTGGIPLQNVLNFCCPQGRVPTVRKATMAKAEPPMQHFF